MKVWRFPRRKARPRPASQYLLGASRERQQVEFADFATQSMYTAHAGEFVRKRLRMRSIRAYGCAAASQVAVCPARSLVEVSNGMHADVDITAGPKGCKGCSVSTKVRQHAAAGEPAPVCEGWKVSVHGMIVGRSSQGVALCFASLDGLALLWTMRYSFCRA